MSDSPARPAKKMRHTLAEESCAICLQPFEELTDVGMCILPKCQHAFCFACVAKDQVQNKKMQCSICKTEHEVSVKLPVADTLAQPQALKLSVDLYSGCFCSQGLQKTGRKFLLFFIAIDRPNTRTAVYDSSLEAVWDVAPTSTAVAVHMDRTRRPGGTG
jgi:hypothetical protein